MHVCCTCTNTNQMLQSWKGHQAVKRQVPQCNEKEMVGEGNLCKIKPCLPYQVLGPSCPFMQQNEAALKLETFSSTGWGKKTAKDSVFGFSSLCLSWVLSEGGEIVFSCLIAPNSQMNLICIFPHFATSPTFNQMKCEKKKIEDHCIGGGGEGVKWLLPSHDFTTDLLLYWPCLGNMVLLTNQFYYKWWHCLGTLI